MVLVQGGSSTVTRLIAVVALAIALVGCSGAPGGGGGGNPNGSPSDVVKAAMTALSNKDMTAFTNMACAAKKDEITSSLTGAIGSIPGVAIGDVLNVLTIDTSKITVGSANESGDNATVTLNGSMSIQFDKAKMKDLMKKVLSAQGTNVDDAQLDAMMGAFPTATEQPINNQAVQLVKEGGAWKICSDLGGS